MADDDTPFADAVEESLSDGSLLNDITAEEAENLCFYVTKNVHRGTYIFGCHGHETEMTAEETMALCNALLLDIIPTLFGG